MCFQVCPGEEVLEIETAPVEEGLESDGERHTERQRDRERETQRETQRETEQGTAHPRGRAASGCTSHLCLHRPLERGMQLSGSYRPQGLHLARPCPATHAGRALKQKSRHPLSRPPGREHQERAPAPTASFSEGVSPPPGADLWLMVPAHSILLGHSPRHQPA